MGNRGAGCGCVLVVIWLICILSIAMCTRSYVNDTPEKASGLASEVIISDGTIDTKNDGKLVMVTGTPVIENEGKVSDPDMDLEATNAISYSRVPYQKVYEKRSKEVVVDRNDISDPYDDEKEIEYYAVTTWIFCNADREASFRCNGKKYVNPEKANVPSYHQNNNLRIGEYTVEASEVLDYIQTSNHSYTASDIENHCMPWIKKTEMDFKIIESDNKVAFLSTGDEIGDIHVYINYTTFDGAKEITIVGIQENGKLTEYTDGSIKLSRVVEGKLTKEDYIKSLSTEAKANRKTNMIVIIICSIILIISIVPFIVFSIQNKKSSSPFK